ncbi:MAG: glycosyltransferase [Aquihabitans sp.]
MPGPVVSLLPARNAAADLPAHLASVAQFADLVVALDDGSTDDTRAILEANPIVHTVLSNPRRESYAGWDDSANRNRLLEAAQRLSPSWVMSLDADELLAGDDAASLRAFLDHSADPNEAYLFRVFRMIGDLEHYDGPALWVGRLFAPRPDHAFPSDRLHFVPLPTAIPRDRWRETTFRIQHRGSLTDARRQARFAKYREADPDRSWQPSYDHLLDPSKGVRVWPPRGAHLPPLAHEPVVDPRPLDGDEPAISVVVIARDDESNMRRAVDAAVAQIVDEPFEVIVVTGGGAPIAARTRERFPEIIVVELAHPALPGAARNAGLHVARGRFVTFPGSHIELAPGSLAARLAAHRRGWPMVAETMLNGTLTRTGWASYFLDNAGVLPGRPSYAFESPPPRCSYRRDLLTELGGFPEDMRTGEDSVVNEELFHRGYGAFREAEVRAYHHSPCRRPTILMAHHFQRGRGRGRMLADEHALGALPVRRMVRNTLRWLPGRLRWTHREVRRWGGGLRRQYWMSLPLVAVGATAAWLGCWYELTRRLGLGRSPMASQAFAIAARQAGGHGDYQPGNGQHEAVALASPIAPGDLHQAAADEDHGHEEGDRRPTGGHRT